jgi:hypothetical protein
LPVPLGQATRLATDFISKFILDRESGGQISIALSRAANGMLAVVADLGVFVTA